MDFLFWRIPQRCSYKCFPWILWYIWRARNDKVFRGIDVDSHLIVRSAIAEAQAWELAQTDDSDSPLVPIQSPGLKCYIDGSWKHNDIASGVAWFAFYDEDKVDVMGARNTRRSLSPLHSEIEALIWAMQCLVDRQEMEVAFASDCLDLVKMVSTPTEWPAFATELKEIQRLKMKFSAFSLSYIPRTRNSRADKLANCTRTTDSNVFFLGTTIPDWMTDWW